MTGSSKRISPGRAPWKDSKPIAQFVHSLVQGLAACRSSAAAANANLRRPLSEVTEQSLDELRTYARVLHREAEYQIRDALNILEVIDPGKTTGLLRPVYKCISPAELLDEMLPGYREMAKDRQIDLRYTDCSQGTASIDLEASSVRRAFHNALSNAIKYSYKGGRETYRYITVQCKRHLPVSGGYEISFENFGVGIKPEELNLVWESGRRGELAEADHTLGSGLGLTQIRECMRNHNGTARIESTQLPGGPYKTELTLIFPVNTNLRRL